MKTEYVQILRPIYKGRPPKNAFLYGDTGVGKTAVTSSFSKNWLTISKRNTVNKQSLQITSQFSPVNSRNLIQLPRAKMQTSPLFNSIAKISTKGERDFIPSRGRSRESISVSEEDELSTTGHALRRYIIGCTD